MSNLQIYIHGEDNRELKLIDVKDSSLINEVITQYLQEFSAPGTTEDIFVFMEDGEDPKEKGKTIKEHTIKNRLHLHFHRCQKISVIVEYNGEAKSFTFAPSITIKKIMRKVIREFNIAESDAGDYLLKLSDGTILQPTDHIGSFTSHYGCQVELFLTPTKPIQG